MIDSLIPSSILTSAGVVGTWVYDHWAGRLSLSGLFPELIGLDPTAAAVGISLDGFLDRIHPEDRIRIENYLHVAVTGGPLEAEFRTCEPGTTFRTLAIRGRIEGGGHAAQSCGIAIDRTEELATLHLNADLAVNRMAEHAIAMRSLAQTLHRPVLLSRVEHLMIEIGFELARLLPDSKGEEESRH